jgi:16S rRNA (cytosine967-C5)-methyltransferase
MAGHNLTSTLDSIFREHGEITPQQRAVAQDLSYGTLRFYGHLQALLAPLLEKPLQDKRAHYLLLVALYQLIYDKAAQHTVVDQAVKAASQLKKPWAKGLVNAVLRNFLRQRDSLELAVANNETAIFSYPQWWIVQIKRQYPENWQAILEAGNQRPPMTLRVNRRLSNVADYSQHLTELGLPCRVISPSAIMLEKPVPVDKLPGFSAGEVSVQDFGAQLAAQLLMLEDGQKVLDACCAPGGKTSHILESANVKLLAIDSDDYRLQRVKTNLERLHLSADLAVANADNPAEWWNGESFDRILADVPCTASGVVRRHVDIKWLRRHADIASFADQQARILRSLWQLLAKGGKLLYVTCSIFQEENQVQIDQFLKNHADANQVQIDFTALFSADAKHAEHYPLTIKQPAHGQLLPCREHDGFFYALLEKSSV